MMSFSNSIKTCFKKYAKFSGRATRAEYWWFRLFFYLVFLSLYGLEILFGNNSVSVFMSIAGLFAIAIILPSISVAVRRLHDTGNSGAFVLLCLIPYIGSFILFIFSLLPSDEDNEYGSKPSKDGVSVLIKKKAPVELPDEKVIEVTDVEL